MLVAYAVYALVVGAVLGAMGLLWERAATALRRPVRFGWLVAMGLTVIAPLVGVLTVDRAVPPTAVGTARTTSPSVIGLTVNAWPPAAGATAVAPSSSTVAALRVLSRVRRAWDATLTRVTARTRSLDRPLLGLWAGGSLWLLAVVWRAHRGARRLRGVLERRVVHETAVLLSDSAGPAAVGVMRPAIVLPRWVLDLDESLLALVLRHEHEHIDARDTAVLACGLATLVLMPWHPMLWWLSRRLRLAIELDCDARVLRSAPQPRAYAQLLLYMSQRAAPPRRSALALSLAFNPRATDLKRRITAMTTRRTPRPVLAAAAGMALLGATAIAVAIPAPPVSHAVRPLATPGVAPQSPVPAVRSVGVERPHPASTSAAPPIYARVTRLGIVMRGRVVNPRADVTVLIYGDGPVRLGIGTAAPRVRADTVMLRTLPAFTVDVAQYDVHVVLLGGAASISIGGRVEGGPAAEFGASGRHLVLLKGGVGIRVADVGPVPRSSPAREPQPSVSTEWVLRTGGRDGSVSATTLYLTQRDTMLTGETVAPSGARRVVAGRVVGRDVSFRALWMPAVDRYADYSGTMLGRDSMWGQVQIAGRSVPFTASRVR